MKKSAVNSKLSPILQKSKILNPTFLPCHNSLFMNTAHYLSLSIPHLTPPNYVIFQDCAQYTKPNFTYTETELHFHIIQLHLQLTNFNYTSLSFIYSESIFTYTSPNFMYTLHNFTYISPISPNFT